MVIFHDCEYVQEQVLLGLCVIVKMEKHQDEVYDPQHDEKADYALNTAFSSEKSVHSFPERGEPSQSHFHEELPPPYIPDVQLPPVPAPPVPSISGPRLQKPIAIPATLASVGSPFLRAYPPALLDFKFPKESFLHFLDNLNRVAVKSPPLQILSVAGGVVNFVPVPPAGLVGMAVNAAAGLGTFVVSKSRSELFLRRANKDIFKPRGLKVEVAKIEAVAKLAGIPVLNAACHIDPQTQLLLPFEDIAQEHTLSGQQRRLDSLKPWLSDLDITPLPPIEVPKNTLSKMNAWASERERARGEARLMKSRRRAARHQYKDTRRIREDYQAEMWKLDDHEAKVRQKETGEQLERELAEINRDRQEIEREYQEELGYYGDSAQLRRDREEKAMRKVLWLVIRNLESDSGEGPNPHVDNTEGQVSAPPDTGGHQLHPDGKVSQ